MSNGQFVANDEGNVFVSLGKNFQEKVVQALLMDKDWASHFIDVFEVDECLEYAYLKVLANRYINYYRQYKEFPSIELLISIIKTDLAKDSSLKEVIAVFLKKVVSNQNLTDLPWVKEKAFAFCRRQKLRIALAKSVDLIGTDKYESVVGIIKDAICAGIPQNNGMNYTTDIDTRYSVTYRKTVPTGIPQIDQKTVLNGGLGAGEIGLIIAPSGTGKTHILVHVGATAIQKKKNVFHYSMELAENIIGIRYDSHITNIPSSECFEKKDLIRDILKSKYEAGEFGHLQIKEYPTRMITCNTIRAHVEKMETQGVRPDLLIVDYAGIMRSTEKFDLPRFELQAVVQELRSLGRELNVPLWTALQSNKEGAKSEFVDMTNASESYGQVAEADFILGFHRKAEQKALGVGSLYVAKNRAGVDGLLYKAHLDTGRSYIRILDETEVENLEEGLKQEERRNALQDLVSTVKKNQDLFQKVLPHATHK